jgi:hypothetical protein
MRSHEISFAATPFGRLAAAQQLGRFGDLDELLPDQEAVKLEQERTPPDLVNIAA